MALVERVPKNGHNDHFNYDFATESDITAAVRMEMARRQLMIFPDAIEAKEMAIGEKGRRVFTQKTRFTIEDGESGESRSFCLYSQGVDGEDKGPYKATTGGVKYALLKLFLIATGDDPERDQPRNASASPPSGATGLRTKVLKKPSPPPAPHIAAAVQRASDATHDRSLVYPFGNCKGLPISDPRVDEKSLAFWMQRLTEELADASKSKWHDNNRKKIATLQAEQAYRARASSTPHAASPSVEEPPPPSDEDAPF